MSLLPSNPYELLQNSAVRALDEKKPEDLQKICELLTEIRDLLKLQSQRPPQGKHR